MKWQDVSKILVGVGGVVGLFSYLFLLTGMDYTHSGDSDCFYKDSIYQAEAFINVSTRYWNFEFEHLSPDTYIYLPADLEDFTGTLVKYKAGDLDFEPVLYKKSTRGRKLWINLNMMDNIIDTQPSIKVDWLVPARGKDNWRLVKEGDSWSRLKNNRIKLIGYPENTYDNIKWSFIVGEVDIDPVWIAIDKEDSELKAAIIEISDKKIKSVNTKKIVFSNLKKDYNIKEEAEKVGKTAKDYLNVKKTNYYGNVNIKLMHFVNVTENVSYDCSCKNMINYVPNGTKITEWVCNTCYMNVTTEVFQEINPETYVLKNNEPIYEIMDKAISFEQTENGWGYAVWTDVNIMDVEIEGATWWNETFSEKKEIQLQYHAENVEQANCTLFLNVSYDSDMSPGFEDIRFSNGSENEMLSYWIEDKVDSSYAEVWVKIPYILSNSTNTTIYMYYDNDTLISTESDGFDTFRFFDDFDDGDYTTGTTWTVGSGTWSAANGYLEKTSATGWNNINAPQNLAYGIYEFDVKIGHAANGNLQLAVISNSTSVDKGYGIYVVHNAEYYFREDIATLFSSTIVDDGNWQKHKIVRNMSGEFEGFVNGSSKGTATDNTITTSEYVVLRNYEQNLDAIDNLRFRKYLAVEPTYSFGPEEKLTTTPTFSLNTENSSYAREDVLHSIYISTSGTLDCSIFSYDNGTGSFINDTVDCSISGSNDWLNTTKRLNYTVGSTIRWIVYANSTDNKLGMSSTYTYDTVGHLQGTVTDSDTSNTVSGVTIWIIDSSDNTTHAITATDASGNWEYDITTAMTVHIVASKNSSYEGDVKNDITVS